MMIVQQILYLFALLVSFLRIEWYLHTWTELSGLLCNSFRDWSTCWMKWMSSECFGTIQHIGNELQIGLTISMTSTNNSISPRCIQCSNLKRYLISMTTTLVEWIGFGRNCQLWLFAMKYSYKMDLHQVITYSFQLISIVMKCMIQILHLQLI